jgi:ornithine carbamoyltransferase
MTTIVTCSIPSQLKNRDFLALSDFTPQDILDLLDLATELKQQRKKRIPHRLLEGKSVALYFEKPSNRTRVSFEVGVFDLGAHPIMIRKEEINLGVRETIADTARTLSRYVDGIMIRTFAQNDVAELAKHASVPVINGLTDDHHPCQVMADLLTVKEFLGIFKSRKLTFIGDGSNNMAHSLLEGCALVGMDVTIATPKAYQPNTQILENVHKIAAQTGSKVVITDNVKEAATNASVLYTDVWTSMGQEAETKQRLEAFKGFQINRELMSLATSDAIVLHCLPAHREEEITADVFEKHAASIFEQAENRLHAQKAVMVALMA